MLSSMATTFSVPVRHGTHLPHDSFRKKRVTFVAVSIMSVPSAMTTRAAAPSMLPALAIVSKSISVSAASAGKKLELAPPGAKALRALPSFTPPARSISSATVIPKRISKTPGFST
jgi:hypothetical protein